MYNTELVAPQDLPASIFDLVDPKWKGQVAAAGSTNGSMQAQIAVMRQLLGEKGTEEWLQGLIDNQVTFFGGHTDVRKAVGAGEFKLGLVNHYYFYLQQAEGSPVGIIFPDQEEGQIGLITNASAAAIVQGAGNPGAAQVPGLPVSRKEQEIFARLKFEYPLLPAAGALPELEPLEGFRLAEVEPARAALEFEATFDLMERLGMPKCAPPTAVLPAVNRRSLNPQILMAAGLVGLFAAIPLAYIILRALGAEAEAWHRLLQVRMWILLRNTLLLAVTVTMGSTVIGVGTAWLTERSNLPGRKIFRWLLALPLAIPAYIGGIVHLTLMRPRGGLFPKLLEDLTGISMPGLNPLGLWGATFILVLFSYPYIYLLSAAAFRSLNASHRGGIHDPGPLAEADFLAGGAANPATGNRGGDAAGGAGRAGRIWDRGTAALRDLHFGDLRAAGRTL
jgi:hypothetical protein